MEFKRKSTHKLEGLSLLPPLLVGLAMFVVILSLVQCQFPPALTGTAGRLLKSGASSTPTPVEYLPLEDQDKSQYMPLVYNGVPTATPTNTPTSTPTKTRTPTPTFTPRPPGVPPPYTTSHYMTTTDYDALTLLGQTSGGQVLPAQNVVIFLDWGQPWQEGGQWGVAIFGSLEFRSTAQIIDAVKGFCIGYHQTAPTNSHLTIALGTSNYDSPNYWGRYVTRDHGVAWAQMVKALNDWIVSGESWADIVTIVGAIDAEPGWNTAANTRAWADGFQQAANGTASTYLNFGSCDSCPFDRCPTCKPSNNWSFEDIWYVSWGVPSAFVVPEIYLPDGANAQQWYRISLYGWAVHGQAIIFSGVMTQMQACNCDLYTNHPPEGWSQLYNLINSDFKTASNIKWLTDIR